MTRRRWIADQVSENRAALTGEHARHLSQVLRAQIGQQFDISTGADLRRGTVIEVHAERVEFELGEKLSISAQPAITIALAVFKFDRMEWAIEKCTELGVAAIIPFVADRTEKHLASAAPKRMDRWRRITRQAAEQSRRVSVPEISDVIEFKDLLLMDARAKIVLSEDRASLSLKDAVPRDTASLLMAFGPEGGWKENELQSFSKAGWSSASLGSTILRCETAAIAATAIVMSALE